MKKFEKKSFGFRKNTDTEIGPWLRFPIQKPGFGCTLVKGSKKLTHAATMESAMAVLAAKFEISR